MMENSTRLRQTALEAAIKLAQYDRTATSYSVLSEAGKFFNWLMTDENQNPIMPVVGQNLDDEIPF